MSRKIFKLATATAIMVVMSGCSTIGPIGGGSASVQGSAKEQRLAAAGLVVSEEKRVKTRHDILFGPGSVKLPDEAVYVISDAAQYLVRNKRKTVSLVGHTDASGTESENMDLSIQRAFAVRNALIAEGIEAHRLEPVGKGEMRPMGSNESVEGRKLNRRVEIIFP